MIRKPVLYTIIAILILVIIVGGIYYILTSTNDNKDTNPENTINTNTNNPCTELGCPYGTRYIGSINSDKFYECDCHYANRIKPENIRCFATRQEALSDNYIWREC